MMWGHRKLSLNEEGAAIIELALIAPIFALMAIGVVDMSNAYSRKLALEQGAQRAIEKIMQTTGDDTVEGTLTTEAVCQVNGMNTDGTCKTSPITAANVTVTDTLECVDADGTIHAMSDFDSNCAATQRESRYISVRLTDSYVPMFPIHFTGYANGGYALSATAGMRTQ